MRHGTELLLIRKGRAGHSGRKEGERGGQRGVAEDNEEGGTRTN